MYEGQHWPIVDYADVCQTLKGELREGVQEVDAVHEAMIVAKAQRAVRDCSSMHM